MSRNDQRWVLGGVGVWGRVLATGLYSPNYPRRHRYEISRNGWIEEADPALATAAGEQRAAGIEKLWLEADCFAVDAQEPFGVPGLKRLAFGSGQAAHAVMMRCDEV
jgi:hypothetical protein